MTPSLYKIFPYIWHDISSLCGSSLEFSFTQDSFKLFQSHFAGAVSVSNKYPTPSPPHSYPPWGKKPSVTSFLNISLNISLSLWCPQVPTGWWLSWWMKEQSQKKTSMPQPVALTKCQACSKQVHEWCWVDSVAPNYLGQDPECYTY